MPFKAIAGCVGGLGDRDAAESFEGDRLIAPGATSPAPFLTCGHRQHRSFNRVRRNSRHSPVLGGGRRAHRVRIHAEVPCLDEEVPDAARLIHVDLDEVARLAPTELAAAPGVLAHERLLND